MLIKTVKLRRLHPDVPKPDRATAHSFGYDVIAVGNHTILPGTSALIPTGLQIAAVLSPGLAMFLWPRSSLFLKKGLMVGNSLGLLDGDFTGEIKLLVFNPIKTTETVCDGAPERSVDLQTPATIKHGERIAQLVFPRFPTPFPFIEMVDEQEQDAAREGFGSTGGYAAS